MILHVNEIFSSWDGEVNVHGIGCPSIFIRLQGCNLMCAYCDTPYAQDNSKDDHVMPMDAVISAVKAYQYDMRYLEKVTITGGEPLLNIPEIYKLVERLNDECNIHAITIETNGTIPPLPYLPVSYVMDYKLRSSGMSEYRLPDRVFKQLGPNDFIKFVILNLEDFGEAVSFMKDAQDTCEAKFAFSPVFGQLHPKVLAGWLKQEKLGAYLNVQLHKVIWGEDARSV